MGRKAGAAPSHFSPIRRCCGRLPAPGETMWPPLVLLLLLAAERTAHGTFPEEPNPIAVANEDCECLGRGPGGTDGCREGTGLGGLGCSVSRVLAGRGAVCDAVSMPPSWCPQM